MDMGVRYIRLLADDRKLLEASATSLIRLLLALCDLFAGSAKSWSEGLAGFRLGCLCRRVCAFGRYQFQDFQNITEDYVALKVLQQPRIIELNDYLAYTGWTLSPALLLWSFRRGRKSSSLEFSISSSL
jgi:hypothetical protein